MNRKFMKRMSILSHHVHRQLIQSRLTSSTKKKTNASYRVVKAAKARLLRIPRIPSLRLGQPVRKKNHSKKSQKKRKKTLMAGFAGMKRKLQRVPHQTSLRHRNEATIA